MQQIGFAAATAAGLKSSGPLTNLDVQHLVAMYLSNLTSTAIAAGMPKTVILTHYGGTLLSDPGGSPIMPYKAGIVPGITLGVSLYKIPLDESPTFQPAVDAADVQWGAVEFGLGSFWAPPGIHPNSPDAWYAAYNRTLKQPGCRLLSQCPLSNQSVAAVKRLLSDFNEGH